jgi:hypothetical protein
VANNFLPWTIFSFYIYVCNCICTMPNTTCRMSCHRSIFEIKMIHGWLGVNGAMVDVPNKFHLFLRGWEHHGHSTRARVAPWGHDTTDLSF